MAVIKNDRDVLLQAAPYRLSDTLVDITGTAGAFNTAKNGGTTLPATITLTATTNNVFTAAAVKTWHYSLNTTPDTWVLLGTGNTRAITAASILAIIGTATEINYRCTVTEPLLNTAYDYFKIAYSKAVSDPIVVDISRTSAVIASDSEGVPLGYTNTDTVIKVSRGGVLNYSATANVANTFTVAAPTLSAGLTISAPVTTATSYGIGNITGVTQDYSTATFVVTVYNAQGVAEAPTIAKQIVYTKVTNGLIGGDAVVNYIETSSPIISKSTSAAGIEGTHSNITVVGKRITGSGLPIVAGYLTITANGDTEATLATIGPITTNINNSAGKTEYTVKLYDQNTVATANLLDTEVIPVVFTGSSAITVSLSNDATSIPTNSAGTAGVYTNSGTTIYTYEGPTVLVYDGIGTANGTWKVVIDQASSINEGPITNSGTFATVGQATNMIADTAYVRYLVTGTTLAGQAFSITKTQTFSKALAGTQGLSTFVGTVYYQGASAPAVPTASTGSYNFSTNTLTPPTGAVTWLATQPATSTVATYASTFTFVGAPTATVTAGTWSTVRLEAKNGIDGASPQYRDTIQLFGTTATAPTTAYYNFNNNTISSTTPAVTAVPNWSLSMPTVTTTPVYMTTKLASTLTPATDVTLTTWSTPVVIAQKGAEGTSTFVATVYLQSASAPATPTSGTGSYNFSNNTLTPPAGWSISQPASSTIGTYASTFTFIGAPTATVTAGTWSATRLEAQNGSPGSNGEYRDMVQLFGTSTVVPTTAYYNFTNNTISSTTPTVTAVTNWSLSMPTVTTTPVYMTTKLASTTTPATDVTLTGWSTATLVAQKGANGDPGASGTKSITISAFKWSNAGAGTFTAAFNYTWSSGAVSAYPAGWTASAPAAPGTGYTLYQINLTITALATDTVTATNWSSAVTNTIGYREDGTIGAQGNSHRTAYTVTTSATAPTGIVAGVGDVAPTGPGTWSFTATSTLSDGQYMYQTDGILVTGGNITWGLAYLSNLKVGSLSALSANLGTVAIGTTGALYSTGKTYGGATGGVFLGYNSTAYKFDVGNSTNYLRWDGSGLEMTGTLRAGQTAYNTGQGFFLGSNGTFSLGNSAGNRLTWDGTDLNVVGTQFSLVNGSATFSGALSAATGSFAGSLSAATGSFSGSLSAATGSFAGSLSAATGTFSGSLTASAINAVNTINIAGNAVSVMNSSAGSSEVSTNIYIPSGVVADVVAVATQDGFTTSSTTYSTYYHRIVLNGTSDNSALGMARTSDTRNSLPPSCKVRRIQVSGPATISASTALLQSNQSTVSTLAYCTIILLATYK